MLMLAPPALAQSPQDRMFPDAASCYARLYTQGHLAQHPEQRVIAMRLGPDFQIADPFLGLRVEVELRGRTGGSFEGYGYCENQGDELYCGLEGEAGGFTVEAARGGSVLVTVTSLGMSFENAAGFVTLEREQGDDRSFLLRPSPCQ